MPEPVGDHAGVVEQLAHLPGYRGIRLREGMVLAIEPMLNAGGPEVELKEDGWTAVTSDGSLSAHFEHSVAIVDRGPYVLSAL